MSLNSNFPLLKSLVGEEEGSQVTEVRGWTHISAQIWALPSHSWPRFLTLTVKLWNQSPGDSRPRDPKKQPYLDHGSVPSLATPPQDLSHP